MKKIIRFATFFILSTFLASQSLVEVAKQEQQRREKLKGKNVRVVTNADLKSVKKRAAVSTQAAPPAEAGTAEPTAGEPAGGQEPAVQEAPEAEGESDRGTGSPYATRVLEDTLLVTNPEAALYPADGDYAEIMVMGQLELEFNARNGPGDDIAIYARWRGADEAMSRFEEEGIPTSAWPGGMFSYGVLGQREDGEWEAIGRGIGTSQPERFDLGSLREIKRIRIMFMPDYNASGQFVPFQQVLEPFTMDIDAVEALH